MASVFAAGWAVLAPFTLVALGLVLGSFAGCLAFRLPRKESISGRSHCERCSYQLRWFDLVPLISFIDTFGRCRSCRQPIGYQTLLAEALGGLLGFVAWLIWGSNPIALIWLPTAIFIGLWAVLWLFRGYLSTGLLLISLILLFLLAVMSQMKLALAFVFGV